MARMNVEQAEQFPQGNSNFFSLQNDKDVATVRFMYEVEDYMDLPADLVHTVKVGDKFRKVSCLKENPMDPVTVCPLCAAGLKPQARVFLNVFNMDSQEVQIWERSLQWVKENLQGLIKRYKPIVGMPFEVERNGAKGDMKTTYGVYPMTSDNIRLKDLPETIDVYDQNIILECSYEDLEEYNATGKLPETANDENVTPRQNSTQRTQNTPTNTGRGSSRRTAPQDNGAY